MTLKAGMDFKNNSRRTLNGGLEMNEQTTNTQATETVETAQTVENKPETAAAKEETNTGRTYTQEEFQAELDAQIQKRLARESKKHQKELAALQKPSEEQVNLADENQALKNQIASLNKQIISQEAAKIASGLNVKPDRLEAFVKIANLSEIELDDKGTYKDEIKEIVEALIKEYPEFLKVEEKKEENKGFVKVGLPQTEGKKTSQMQDELAKILGVNF